MTTLNPLPTLATRPQDAPARHEPRSGAGPLQAAALRLAADAARGHGTLPAHGHSVPDFSTAPLAAGGDAIDLRELLRDQPKGLGRDAGALAKHLSIDTASSPGSTILRISRAGLFTTPGRTVEADERVTLAGVDLRATTGLGPAAADAQVIAELLARGQLLADFA